MNKLVRKISLKLHLWLGLLSGIVVFIVCITGCLYAFRDEVNDLMHPWKFVEVENDGIKILPSRALQISNSQIKDLSPSAITYGEEADAIIVDYYKPEKGLTSVFINPYDERVIKIQNQNEEDFDFFRFIIKGHKMLWLPAEIGRPIVGYGTLIFVITLITGIILWYPRRWTMRNVKNNFTIKFNARFSRLNFDLHNVLGIYSAIFLIVLSFTGLMRSFDWFSKTIYFLGSGGENLQPYILPKSKRQPEISKNIVDKLYLQLLVNEPKAKSFYIALPYNEESCIRVSVVHERGSYYKTDNLFFDQYTLHPLEGAGPFAGKYKAASTAIDKYFRMNLEIHDGRILGIWGKIIAFCASLVGASLPVTGIIIYLRKRKQKNKAIQDV